MSEAHPDDAPVTRDEINRLWANQRAIEILLAETLAPTLSRAAIESWRERAIAGAGEDRVGDPLAAANARRAIDRLAVFMAAHARAAGSA